MALTCEAGYYFDDISGCRNCDFVCGDEYGGREGLECRESCPGYGVSTTSAPASDSDNNVVWILVVFIALVVIITATIAIICCFKKKRCRWKPQTKHSLVQEESTEGLNAKSASTFERV